MNKVGAYGVCRNNMDILHYPLRNKEKEQILIRPVMQDTSVAEEHKSFQECLAKASGMSMDDISWGRVIQKEENSAVGKKDELRGNNRNMKQNGAGSFMCGFVETPTAVELFEKDRNMDRRNVEERIFAIGGKVLDFTV